MHTLAAIARKAGQPLRLEEARVPALAADDVLVGVRTVGVCHTDLLAHAGKLPVEYPVVLGHEGFGRVLAVGAGVSSLAAGDAVVLSFASCGTCRHCAGHQPGYCDHFVSLNMGGWGAGRARAVETASGRVGAGFFGQSSFGRHVVCSQSSAVKVQTELPAHLLAPLGCGVQTGAGTVINSLALHAGASLLVAGAGAVGLSAIMTARALGAGVIVAVDRNPARCSLALSLGADVAIDTSAHGGWLEVVSARLAHGVDFAIDTTGVPQVIEQLVQALARRGSCALVGVSAMGQLMQVEARHLMGAGRIIRGVVEGDAWPHQLIPRMVGMVETGQLPLDKLITPYPFADINQAFADAASGRAVKPVICVDEDDLRIARRM